MSTLKPVPRMFLPDEALGVGVVERLGEALLGQRHLAAHVEERLRGLRPRSSVSTMPSMSWCGSSSMSRRSL